MTSSLRHRAFSVSLSALWRRVEHGARRTRWSSRALALGGPYGLVFALLCAPRAVSAGAGLVGARRLVHPGLARRRTFSRFR